MPESHPQSHSALRLALLTAVSIKNLLSYSSKGWRTDCDCSSSNHGSTELLDLVDRIALGLYNSTQTQSHNTWYFPA